MRVQTYNLRVMFRGGYEKIFYNLSRVAVKSYIDWYIQEPSYVGFHYETNELKRSNNWLAGT